MSHLNIWPGQTVQNFLNNIYSSKSRNKNLKAIKVTAFTILKNSLSQSSFGTYSLASHDNGKLSSIYINMHAHTSRCKEPSR